MDDPENDFDSVQWHHREEEQSESQAATSKDDAGKRPQSKTSHLPPDHNADAVDTAGIGPEGYLECVVGTPQKEHEGTKDAYISYLISTNVRLDSRKAIDSEADRVLVGFQDLFEIRVHCQKTLHRFRLPLQDTFPPIHTRSSTSAARQTQDGIRPRRSVWPRLHAETCPLPSSFHKAHNTPPGTQAQHDLPELSRVL